MSHDCFGFPNGDVPPSISDTFHDIQTYGVVPLPERLAYHYARVDAMLGRASAEAAWAKLRAMNLKVRRATR